MSLNDPTDIVAGTKPVPETETAPAADRVPSRFCCFVTGTDTEIGKTLVSAAILHKLVAGGDNFTFAGRALDQDHPARAARCRVERAGDLLQLPLALQEVGPPAQLRHPAHVRGEPKTYGGST